MRNNITYSITLLTLALFISFTSHAQKWNGKVLCKETGKSIEYANIGIVGKNVGTTTDVNGLFTIELSNIYDNDKIRISSIGFEAMEMKVRDFKSVYKAGSIVYLPEQQNELKEVVVKPRKMKNHRLGNTGNSGLVSIGFDSTIFGYEVGVLMHPGKVPAYIDSVRINVVSCDYDTVFLRLNIYENIDTDFVNILKEPIYITMSARQAEKKHIKLDLTKYHITVSQNFFISVEMVKDLGGKRMHFCGTLFTHNTYVRRTSQGNWRYFPIAGPAISAYVRY